MTIQFNHKDSSMWDVLAKSLIDAGFEITDSSGNEVHPEEAFAEASSLWLKSNHHAVALSSRLQGKQDACATVAELPPCSTRRAIANYRFYKLAQIGTQGFAPLTT